ncbi:MAG: hypothetical protein CXR31_07520 [Geobacter sp.]|nr:MAG: hypothetical protein CXR31_07520 [Geobacter sp.]
MNVEFSHIERLLGSDLRTHDPYDLWRTGFGLWLKKLYYGKGKITIPIVGPFYLLDMYAPRLIRLFIKPQEYPAVRAFAVLIALNYFQLTSQKKFVDLATESVDWLVANQSKGYSGACWGFDMPWMTKTGCFPPLTPFITTTPYCVEALVKFSDVTKNEKYLEIALSSLHFLDNDLHKLVDNAQMLAVSYGPSRDKRIVINGNAYAMMLYSLLANRIAGLNNILQDKAHRICNFIESNQNDDGSWPYYADKANGNFIDCYHSCYILKNIIKYSENTGKDTTTTINRGIEYILTNFYDQKYGLARKFTVKANPTLAKFDIYDQAELLNLLLLTGQRSEAEKLYKAIHEHFYVPSKESYGYQIDILGKLNKMSYLRWAVMPMLYAQSEYYKSSGIKDGI